MNRAVAVLAILFTLAAVSSVCAENSWETDLKKAQEEAKAKNKLLLINFTDYADKNLVLLEIDFPRRKEQSPAIKQQNEKLAAQYQIEGFPTVVVLNGEGRAVWHYEGYFQNGPEAFIAELEKLRKG